MSNKKKKEDQTLRHIKELQNLAETMNKFSGCCTGKNDAKLVKWAADELYKLWQARVLENMDKSGDFEPL